MECLDALRVETLDVDDDGFVDAVSIGRGGRVRPLPGELGGQLRVKPGGELLRLVVLRDRDQTSCRLRSRLGRPELGDLKSDRQELSGATPGGEDGRQRRGALGRVGEEGTSSACAPARGPNTAVRPARRGTRPGVGAAPLRAARVLGSSAK